MFYWRLLFDGTVILANPKTLSSSKPQDDPLFSLGDASGIVGITFYYVEQSASNVKNYGYTIYANAPATTTLRNLTFLNSTYGIGVSLNTFANELVNLENIYGTFLYNDSRDRERCKELCMFVISRIFHF